MEKKMKNEMETTLWDPIIYQRVGFRGFKV